MHGRPAVLLSLLALAATPAAAAADTTVEVSGDAIVVTSTGDIDSRLGIRPLSGGGIEVHDDLQPAITAVAPCRTSSPNRAECPDTGIARVVAHLGDGDDFAYLENSSLDAELYGEGGQDTLSGDGGDDIVDGGDDFDVISGRGGADVLRGGGARDLVFARETGAQVLDPVIDCGEGDDNLTAQNDLETAPISCESVVPQWTGTGTLTLSGTFTEGQTVTLDPLPLNGTPGTIEVQWQTCDAALRCDPLPSSSPDGRSVVLPPGTAGRRVRAGVIVEHRDSNSVALTGWTEPSDVIQPGPRPQPPVPTPPPAPPVAPVAQLKDLSVDLTAELGRLVPKLQGRAPRAVAAAVTYRVLPPASGRLTVRWTIPAALAKRHGVRTRGGKPVTIAQGTAKVTSAGRTVGVTVRPTTTGKRVLRKARSLKLTVALKLVPTTGKAVEVKAPVTLKAR